MSKTIPSSDEVEVILSDESSSDGDTDESINKQLSNYRLTDHSFVSQVCEVTIHNIDPVTRKAEIYQDYMKQIPIPSMRGSVLPFHSWTELAKSMKQLYEQPLHYLTNVHINKWDKMRIGSIEEDRPLDTILHPCKAEMTIWLMEETHRSTTSHHYLAKLWHTDPVPHAFIDPIPSSKNDAIGIS